MSAASVSFASPTSASSQATDLLRSAGSRVAWMIRLPCGMRTPNAVSEKLQPMPRIRSARSRKWRSGPGTAAPPAPSASAMGLVERALAREARADGRGEQLGQRRELVISFGPMDALAGIDDRPLGRDERVGRRGDRLRIGCGAGAHDGRMFDRPRHLLAEHVPGQLDQHRARPAVAQLGEGAPEDIGQLGRSGERLGMLGDAAHVAHRIVIVGHVGEAAA